MLGLACDNGLLPPTPTPNDTICNSVLLVKGICLDTIEKPLLRPVQGMVFKECLEMGGWADEVGLEN